MAGFEAANSRNLKHSTNKDRSRDLNQMFGQTNKNYCMLNVTHCDLLGHVHCRCPQRSAAEKVQVDHRVNFILNDRKLYCNLRGFCNRNESILQFYMIQVRALLADYLLPDIDMGNFEYCTLADYLGRTDKFPVVRPCIDCMYYSAWVDAVKAPIKLCSVFKCYVQC